MRSEEPFSGEPGAPCNLLRSCVVRATGDLESCESDGLKGPVHDQPDRAASHASTATARAGKATSPGRSHRLRCRGSGRPGNGAWRYLCESHRSRTKPGLSRLLAGALSARTRPSARFLGAQSECCRKTGSPNAASCWTMSVSCQGRRRISSSARDGKGVSDTSSTVVRQPGGG